MSNTFIPVINSILHEPQASLLNGILFGTKATLSKNLYNALVATGTLHIVALSGMNITILANLVARATFFLGKKLSMIMTMIVIWFFVWFVGFSPPIVRAAIMGSLSLTGLYFGRQYWSLLSLILASMVMLLVDFSLVKNLSFQLSFLATLGIILANREVVRHKKNSLIIRIKDSIFLNFRLTFSAQLFTLPVILYNFKRLSLVSPIANILIEWVIQPIMILGFSASILGLAWLPLGVIPAYLSWVPLTYLIKVVEILEKIPGAQIVF